MVSAWPNRAPVVSRALSPPDEGEVTRGRFSETQLVTILRKQASGQPGALLMREPGLGEATFYAWKSKYAGARVAEFARLKHLEEENGKLKRS